MMYYRVPDGEPTAQIKRLLPSVINPQNLDDDDLAALGIARVVVEYPQLEWWQQRAGRIIDASEQPHRMSWGVEDLPLEQVKDLAWQRVKAEREARKAGLMPYDYSGEWGVLHNQMTERTCADLSASTTGALAMSAAGVTDAVIPWTTHENVTVLLTPDQTVAFGVAALQWLSAIHVRSQQMRTAIEAAEDVAGVVAEAEWGG
ncbi:MAG: DUF4376 domain-containing protein [Thauera sp.]|jgi:hypothetical protein|nr:DUF4376 domain-containing protein [Thauera sp.]